jgi:linoleate 10R-lipoxygenase
LCTLANTPYGRSVPQVHPLPQNQLPSPELIFDALLKREKQVDHPAGLSSMFFAFANLVMSVAFVFFVNIWDRPKKSFSHMIFHTDFESDEGINKTSSYLDFS